MELTPGKIIVERQGKGHGVTKIVVRTVEFSQDSCRGVHINGNMCYERLAEVEVE